VNQPQASIHPSPTEPSPAPRRRGFKIPAPVAIGLVAILAIIAGWIVYKQAFDQQKIDLTKYETTDGPTAQARRRFFNQPAQPAQTGDANAASNVGTGVIKRGTGFDVRVVGARARFTFDDASSSFKLDASFVDMGLFPPRDKDAARARYAALNNAALAEKTKVTPEQIEALKKLTFPRDMALTDDLRKGLLELAAKYKAAGDPDKPAIETELTNAFRDTSTKALQPTVEAYRDAADKVRAILSDTQITTLARAN